MLKHLDNKSTSMLLKILNACIILETIPKTWKQSAVYPISKKPKFNGQLNQTRPITLIEHARKIFTKILTRRISKIYTQYPILNENNYVALPNTSTAIPIQTLTHILEDAHTNNNQLWLLISGYIQSI